MKLLSRFFKRAPEIPERDTELLTLGRIAHSLEVLHADHADLKAGHSFINEGLESLILGLRELPPVSQAKVISAAEGDIIEEKICSTLGRTGRTSTRELIKVLGCANKTFYSHIGKLVKSGRVKKEKVKGKVFYQLVEQVEQ